MISVNDALDHLFALVGPSPVEMVLLRAAAGRVLASDVAAARTQPPFDASAMDGYAVRDSDVKPGETLTIIGESAAGHRFDGTVAAGQAVRIFTGAPVPKGSDRVVIQEDVTRDGDKITLNDGLDKGFHIRPAGQDFMAGDALTAPRVLSASDVALLAAMNIAQVPVTRKPVVAIVPTGDELVQPGEDPGQDQIIASNSYGLAALITEHGATARLLPIAKDTIESLTLTLRLAKDADLIITIGGASVGDHDLVAQAAAGLGLEQQFYKVAMRPGKPLMAGRLGDATMIGLPGNPVSAMVCGHVFVLPVLRKMLGLGAKAAPRGIATLTHDIPANGPREHYMRAKLDSQGLTVFERQNSALLRVLADANCLAVRPPNDPARSMGENLEIIKLLTITSS
jgi:molybdopterin molybdotransferase